jgi:ABC-2 type transport system permease protein
MTERNRLRSVLTLAYLNGIVPMRTQPLFLVSVLASPLSFLFFVTIASGGVFLKYAVTGGMLFTMLSIGTSLQTDLTHYRTDLKLQDMVVASPVEGPVYVTGLALSELLYSLPGLAVFAALWATGGPALGATGTHAWPVTVPNALTIGFTLLLVWAFATALGFTLATYFEDVREIFLFSSLISLGLTVFPPVYYPLSALPPWAQTIAYFSPTTYAAQLLHATSTATATPIASLAADWGVLLAFTVGLLVLAGAKARWREP